MEPDNAKRLLGPGFPGDVGDVSPSLDRALAAYEAAYDEPEAGAGGAAYAGVLAALHDARLLVPVVAVLGESERDAAGLVHDKSSDMAAVLLQGDDGRLALLAFSGLDALRRWDPAARPVPVAARTAAQSAVQEGADALVVDLAGPVRLVVEGDDVRALAAGWQLTRLGDRRAWIRPAPE